MLVYVVFKILFSLFKGMEPNQTAKMMICPICQQEFTQSDLMIHVNVCLDTSEAARLMQSTNLVQTTLTTAGVSSSTANRTRKTNPKNPCPICGKLTTATHVKNCQKKHGVLPRQTVNLMRQYQPSSPQISTTNPPPMATSTTAPPTATVLVAGDMNTAALDGFAFESLTIAPPNDIRNNMNENSHAVTFQPSTSDVCNRENRIVNLDETDVKMVKKGRQTKLRVTKRKTVATTPSPDKGKSKKGGISDCVVDSPNNKKEQKKTKYVITLKKQPNPMRPPKLEGLLLQNFKENHDKEEKIPKLWRMSNMVGNTDDFVCPGFEEFIHPPTSKTELTGFFKP